MDHMIDDSNRLKPCPFCGGEAEVDAVDAGQPNEGGFFAACLKCGASTNLRFACGEDPVQLVQEQWNKRVAHLDAGLRDAVLTLNSLWNTSGDEAAIAGQLDLCRRLAKYTPQADPGIEADAMRFRWLTEDHADPKTRAKCRDLLARLGTKGRAKTMSAQLCGPPTASRRAGGGERVQRCPLKIQLSQQSALTERKP